MIHMKYQDFFEKYEEIFENHVVCCSSDWYFKGSVVRLPP